MPGFAPAYHEEKHKILSDIDQLRVQNRGLFIPLTAVAPVLLSA